MQAGVEVGLDQLDVLQQLGQSLERVVLALDRDQHLVGGDERVDGEQPQARRAVDEDVVQPGARRSVALAAVGLQGPQQPVLPGHQRHQLDLGAGQVQGRRRAEQVREVGRVWTTSTSGRPSTTTS